MTYDRSAAADILARLAGKNIFTHIDIGEPRGLAYTSHRMSPEPGQHLTLSQRLYLEKFMRPCPPAQITSATHRISWTDSDDVPCTGHYTDGGLGPAVPVVAREATLAVWHALAAHPGVTFRSAALTKAERSVLADTTTDQDPTEIFRVGVEAAGRALAQHALVAGDRPDLSAAGFATAMRDGGVFAAVAGQWFWELQASTYRRGMIPVRFAPGGQLRYTAVSVQILHQMKAATIADAHEVMRKATTVDLLTEDQAVQRYHTELDLISRQYALLPAGTRPRCLAQNTVIPDLTNAYVDAFTRLLPIITLDLDHRPVNEESDAASFSVPDMNCRHCQMTIRNVLEAMDLTVHEVDLVTKQVTVADFRSPRSRRRALQAVRDSGYTVLEHTVLGDL